MYLWACFLSPPALEWKLLEQGLVLSSLYLDLSLVFHTYLLNEWINGLSFWLILLGPTLMPSTQEEDNRSQFHNINHFHRGTQELNILFSVDRLKWLMQVERCYARNWNAWPSDSRRSTSNSTSAPQGVCRPGGGICIMFWGGNVGVTDKDLLISR